MMRPAKLFLALMMALLIAVRPAIAIPQLLIDMKTGEVLYEQQAGQPWHPASLTKLMTAYLAFEAVATGRMSLSSPVTMSRNALKAPPSKMGFPVDTALTLEDALYILIVKSANDVATAIAEAVGGSEENFIAEMNRAASRLGLTGTHFSNANGLHDPSQYTTARDMALLALTIRAQYPQYDDMFATRVLLFGKSRLESQNDLLTGYAGSTGMKTGYVCSSGLNIVATADRRGRSLMAVVFGGSSGRERGEMAASLLDRGFSGELRGTGRLITNLGNTGGQPTDMRPYLCGTEAADYVAERKRDFPWGLEGQPSYLDDDIAPREVRVSVLGRLRDIPLPRKRPYYAAPVEILPAVVTVEAGGGVPLPRPRPNR